LLRRDMIKQLRISELAHSFTDNDSCLEWLKNQLYPEGIICSKCKSITRHYKVSHKPCYVCSKCGSHVYPAAGTLFHKSTTPLPTWFRIIYDISAPDCRLTAKDLQRQYGMTYKTAWRIYKKVKEFLYENNTKDAADINKYNAGDTNYPDYNVSRGTVSADPITYKKRDRSARLLRLLIILHQYPEGLKIEQISAKCEISKRTAYRDLEALESELGIPLWEEGNRRGIVKGYFLPPIHLSTEEASLVFMAACLMQSFSYLNHPVLVSTFLKLNSILPSHVQKQVQNVLDHIEILPEKKERNNKFSVLLQAWLTQRTVSLFYLYHDEDKPKKLLIDPYFIEASIIGSSIYVIAFCHQNRAIKAFKLESIIGEVILEPDSFIIPADFNPIEHLGEAWGIHFDDRIKTVKLRCRPNLNRLMLETRLHSSQKIQQNSDGSITLTLKVRDSIHFCQWVLGWGAQIEVLDPPELRKQVKEMAKSILNVYPEQ
jgi:predicted DNA-binding transcriptional regulator YafY